MDKTNMNEIVLTVHKPKECACDVIRISPEAARVLNELMAQTGLPVKHIASSIIVQGSAFVRVVEE
jgi:hypothetical protein